MLRLIPLRGQLRCHGIIDIGAVHGIHAKLAELDAKDGAYKPLTKQARIYVQHFQFDDYFRFLKAYCG